MQTLEAIAKRKSTRSYTSELISEETLQAILKAGCAAPIAMARYDSVHITVVQDQAMLDQIEAAAEEVIFKAMGVRKKTLYGGKTLILVSSQPIHRTGMEYINVGIVVENMVLAATDLGIDNVILGGAPSAVAQIPELIQALGIPEGFVPMSGIVLGYGTEDTPAKEHTIAINRV